MSKKKITEVPLSEKIARIEEIRVSGWPMTPDQKSAMLKAWQWLEWARGLMAVSQQAEPPIFRLFGLAGCGKTTCSVAFKSLGLRPLYVSFTNRAVSVLVSKGCYPARTLHSILYDCMDGEPELAVSEEAQRQAYLDAALAGVPVEERPPLPTVKKNEMGWKLRDVRDLLEIVAGHDCIVVDEASMVGKKMGKDLYLLGLPIFGIGDPGQLKPVGDDPFFSPKSPDVLLTEVLRTDGDILDLASFVRRGGSFLDMPPGQDYEVTKKAKPEWFDVDQVLCGIHAKRRELNKHVRKLRGYCGIVPNVGEKLCVVTNHKVHDMTNGSLWIVEKVHQQGDYAIMNLVEYAPRKKPEELERREDIPLHLSCLAQDIKDKNEMPIEVRPNSILATWGYAITVHKSQGSEWNTVLLFDDSPVFRGEERNWKYTGATRAAKKLFVVSRH